MKTLLGGLFWDSITNAIMLCGVILSALALHFLCRGLQKLGKYIIQKRK
jgi:hypothetical protein